MRMSCNGCRVLRKGCSEDCSIRPCLQWIKNPESQANATVFLAKFYGRAGLMNLINAGPEHLRPAIFRSLLYEACGRIVNPIYGSVGLLWSGSWQLCQAAVEAVLKGEPITPITSEAATNGQGPPLKAYDIRHVSRNDNSANQTQKAKTRSRFKRTGGTLIKPKASKGTGFVPTEPEANRTASHESALSHLSEAAAMVEGERESKESESVVSVETSNLFHEEPESVAKVSDRTGENGGEIGLELTLGFEPFSRAYHVVPVKKRRIIELKSCGDSAEKESCKTELGLEYSA
ncbi:LOB domain-containing protein 41 [Spatholobus suberectus]|nr:LOB domain-containing protein 41 [Spatholobus suberectus]